MKKSLVLLFFGLGFWHLSTAGYMLAKAELSQYLIAHAWQKTLNDHKWHKPWSWADTYPVFELSFPRIKQKSYILEGASGRNLAFSATHLSSSGMPQDNRTTIVSGHRDSHFSYLKEVKIGDIIVAKSANHETNYLVKDIKVIDSSKYKLQINKNNNLILTTCFPFDSLSAGGVYRYVLYASAI